MATRCGWARSDLSIAYHDAEWGVPVHDDRVLFEFLILEGAQAGLSWETILRKRDAYRTGVRRIRSRAGRALLSGASRAHPRRCRHRPQPAQGRERRHQRQGVSPSSVGIRELRCLCLEHGGRRAAREPTAGDVGRAGTDVRFRRAEPRSSATRIPVRRLDDLLRLHAGRWSRQRPHERLFSAECIRAAAGVYCCAAVTGTI